MQAQAQAQAQAVAEAERLRLEREKQEAELEALHAALRTVIEDVKNANQFEAIQVALENLSRHPLCTAGDGSTRTTVAKTVEVAKGEMKRLEHMWQLKKSVEKLNQKTIAEIKSFNIPLPEIEKTMRAVFLLLGCAPKDIATWMNIKVMIGKTGKDSLKRRISSYVASADAAPASSVASARKLLGDIAVERIAEVSAGAFTFYGWATGVVSELDTNAHPH